MAFSVESRLPFLDYRLVEFALSLPDDFKIKNGKRKFILRESMKHILPKQVYQRYDKLGFPTPELHNNKEFYHLLKRAIASSRGIINESIYQVDDFEVLWRVMAFGLWMEVFGVEL